VGIFDRLGRVIRTYLEDEEGRIFSRPRRADPDMEAAEAEVVSFLRREGRGKGGGNQSGGFRGGGSGTPGREGALEKLRGDFAELGLPLGAGPEECKAAYKRLLKLHHPDRHAGH
jgi:DnaJ-domain-containing protein 1